MLDWVDRILKEAPTPARRSGATPTAPARPRGPPPRNIAASFTEIIGSLPESTIPLNRVRARSMKPIAAGHEVVLDVYEDVFAYGILLLPRASSPAATPVVVCQHGLEGRPQEITDPAINSHYYMQYDCKLAEEVSSSMPPEPLHRWRPFPFRATPAAPLALQLHHWQHRQTLKWLGGLPLSIPASPSAASATAEDRHARARRAGGALPLHLLGDFNEWIWKNVTRRRSPATCFGG